ncbi:MAG: hypothetical protein IKT07_04170 [Oscillospiraceae bacterium]|nr:hypothetical protein [Oscillospiraceae bacterium]
MSFTGTENAPYGAVTVTVMPPPFHVNVCGSFFSLLLSLSFSLSLSLSSFLPGSSFFASSGFSPSVVFSSLADSSFFCGSSSVFFSSTGALFSVDLAGSFCSDFAFSVLSGAASALFSVFAGKSGSFALCVVVFCSAEGAKRSSAIAGMHINPASRSRASKNAILFFPFPRNIDKNLLKMHRSEDIFYLISLSFGKEQNNEKR